MKMKQFFWLLLCVISTVSCAQKTPLKGETAYQRKLNADFKDATKSPLSQKDRKTFEGLEFFKFDSTYIVTANFKRTPNEKTFKMKTTTNRAPLYVKYGELTFSLKGLDHKLNLYQNIELKEDTEKDESMFLSFLDDTNGDGSYGGGRYINLKTPTGNTVIIDFNKAYNPYCAYNEKFSCPVVPRENYINVRVEAGVKDYNKH